MMKLKLLLEDKKIIRIIFILGLAGILIIFLSTFFTNDQKVSNTVEKQEPPLLTNKECEERYQKIVKDLVNSISGAGRSNVIVTLDSGVEYVYETEEDKTADTQNNASESHSERNSLKRTTLLVEDANGMRKPLLKKTLEPKIRGVVVVCEGGGDLLVIERVTSAVTTALGISSTRVCVTELSSESLQGGS